MTQYIAKVGDVSVPFRDHSWAIIPGFVAPIQKWVMPRSKALGIMAKLVGSVGSAREVTLTLGDPADPIIVKRVYVLGTAPADNPQRLNLLLCDVRFYFTRAVMVYDLNVRRRVGETHLVGDVLTGAGGAALGTVADTIAFGSWSIDGDSAYNWDGAKRQALDYLTIKRHGRPTIEWTTDPLTTLSNIKTQVIQETTSDGDGTAGLARAIESFPGAGIYPDLDGVVHVYDAVPGAEIPKIDLLPPALWRHGDLQKVDCSAQRASTYRVYSDYAIEVRFDFSPQKTTSAELDAVLSITHLENVLQVTDLSLTIPAGPWGPNRVVGQGTWISVEEAYAAWGGKNWGVLTLPVLTDEIVSQHWMGDSLWRYASGGGLSTEDPIWASRIAQLMKCWRTYFRVNSFFWDKIRHLWNVRAAVWDTVTGTRAPSPVYSNFHYWMLDNWVATNIDVYGHDVLDSFNVSGLLKDGRPSGFEVNIIDQELMVFAIQRDPIRFAGHTKIIPSPVTAAATIDGVNTGLAEARLQDLVTKDKWTLSVIMTCSPAAPNDLRRCYEVIVPTADIWTALGLEPQQCDGPDQELRTHLAEARVAWQESDLIPVAIATTFGGPTGAISDADPVTALKPVNRTLELEPLAKALAISDLLPRLDHYEGTRAVPMDKTIVPIGSISSVTHRVTHNRAVTVVEADRPSIGFDATNFLRGSARSYLLKQIQSER